MRFLLLLVFLIYSNLLSAQNSNGNVDFTRIDVEILPIINSKEIFGKGTYDFEIKAKTDSIFVDAKNMTFFYVSLNGKQIGFSNSGKQLSFKAPTQLGNHQLFLRYTAKPKQTVYFIDTDEQINGNEQVWTQGQGKYTSHWLPSFDDMTEKVELDLTILADEEYTVIANGKVKDKSNEAGISEWKFDMVDPMSSYLAAFAIGRFKRKEITSSSGIPIELYYEPKDSLKVEPTYRYTKEIFDFLEKEIDVPYPWQNYKQVPVQDFLYAGMENTGTTIFSNSYMIDSTAFVDKNYVNVNAHELAHQWFGNLVTEESSKHHWLHEGFATYYAYLTEKELFGAEYFYWKLYDTARTLHNLSENGGGEALTDPNANSLTFYEKGAWALVMLKEKVEVEAFRKGIRTYLEKHQFENVTIADFLIEIETASNQSLDDFKEKWLESEKFPWVDVKEFLKKESESVALVFEMEDEFQKIKSDDLDYDSYWDRTNSINFKEYLIKKHHRVLPTALIDKAFSSQDVKLRQALSTSLFGISKAQESSAKFIAVFETLLNDKSYITVENALIKLWSTFPQKRVTYLSRTEDVIGLPNKNIRMLWLALALITPEFQPEKKQLHYKELNGYTSSDNHFEVRQLAFQYLSQIQAMSDKALINLIKASEHHVWQFKKSSRNLLKELSKSKEGKDRLLNIANTLNAEQRNALKKLINL